MAIRIHPHARERMRERGATPAEVIRTVSTGTSRPAKFGRWEYRQTFNFNAQWLEKHYAKKRIEAFVAHLPNGDRLVVSILVKYF